MRLTQERTFYESGLYIFKSNKDMDKNNKELDLSHAYTIKTTLDPQHFNHFVGKFSKKQEYGLPESNKEKSLLFLR